jgi:feruloyl esterase
MKFDRTPKTAAFRLSLLLGCTATAIIASPALASTCTSLTSADIAFGGHATVTAFSVQDVTGGSFTEPGTSTTLTGLPPFCRVALVASSNGNPVQSQSAIEIWLPEVGWNGRYIGYGNGGFAGSINYGSLELGLFEGFAAANTDMGTGLLFGCNSL